MKRYLPYIEKKGLVFLLLLTMTVAAPSCKKWLDQKASSNIQDNDVEDSDNGADTWVVGAYSSLTRMFTYGEFPRVLELDNDYIAGPGWGGTDIGRILVGNFQPGQGSPIDPTWNLSYNLINRTNEAIYHINLMKNVTAKQKQNDLGELYFLQAYGYFLLVRAYGAVPVFKMSINQGDSINQPRSPIPQVYAHIIDLLSQAKTMIYKNTDNGFKEGRVCAGAAATLLAKVYVTIGSASLASGATVTVKGGNPYKVVGGQNVLSNPVAQVFTKQQVAGYESFDSKAYYTKARDLADSIVFKQAYGNHGLQPYNILWKKAGQTSYEQLFSLQTKSGDDYYGAPFTSLFCGQYRSGKSPNYGFTGNGYVFGSTMIVGMRDHWYKLFEPKDYRIVLGVIHRWQREWDLQWNSGEYYPNNTEWTQKAQGVKDANGNIITPPVAPFNDGVYYTSPTGDSYTMAFVNKYLGVTDSTLARTDAIYPLLRYADAVLIFAEASNEVDGPNNNALTALNMVRTRSNATPKMLSDIGTKDAFRSAVIEERAMEFATESDRRWDLIRWGIYLPVMNSIGGNDEYGNSKTRDSKHLLYPLPATEILSNTAIQPKVNNPGWSIQ